mgnify:CR=1 FL=1
MMASVLNARMERFATSRAIQSLTRLYMTMRLMESVLTSVTQSSSMRLMSLIKGSVLLSVPLAQVTVLNAKKDRSDLPVSAALLES